MAIYISCAAAFGSLEQLLDSYSRAAEQLQNTAMRFQGLHSVSAARCNLTLAAKKLPRRCKSAVQPFHSAFVALHSAARFVRVYTNISSCVVNNGYSSEFFSLQRAVRQGCPLSGLLFVLAVEPLAHQIRIDESIKGLENRNKITKLSMYADDTTAFIRDDSSAVSLLTLLDQFGDLSGLKINKSKTEGLWLGPLKSLLGKEEPFGISWLKQYVIVLGIAFPCHVHVWNQINFNEKLAKLKKVLNAWSSRHLVILGRIAIVKSLVLAKLVYSCFVLNVLKEFVKEVDSNIVSFI